MFWILNSNYRQGHPWAWSSSKLLQKKLLLYYYYIIIIIKLLLYYSGFSRVTEPIGDGYLSLSLSLSLSPWRDYYKKLAHLIMKAEKSQDLQSARWRPGRADSVFQSEFKGLGTRRANGVSSSRKTTGLRTKSSWYFTLSLKAGKDQCPSQKAVRQEKQLSIFLFFSGFQLIGWDLPTLGRAICFTQSSDSSINLLQKHPHKGTFKMAEE